MYRTRRGSVVMLRLLSDIQSGTFTYLENLYALHGKSWWHHLALCRSDRSGFIPGTPPLVIHNPAERLLYYLDRPLYTSIIRSIVSHQRDNPSLLKYLDIQFPRDTIPELLVREEDHYHFVFFESLRLQQMDLAKTTFRKLQLSKNRLALHYPYFMTLMLAEEDPQLVVSFFLWIRYVDNDHYAAFRGTLLRFHIWDEDSPRSHIPQDNFNKVFNAFFLDAPFVTLMSTMRKEERSYVLRMDYLYEQYLLRSHLGHSAFVIARMVLESILPIDLLDYVLSEYLEYPV